MCKYMILKNEIPMCENGKMCTLCVLGNQKTYNELENNENNNNTNQHLSDIEQMQKGTE